MGFIIVNKYPFWLTLLNLASFGICLALVVGTFAVLQFSRGLPNASTIKEIELKIPLRVYSADGVLISEFGNERRIPVDYDETPKALIDAVLASEDDNFFNHFGIDPMGLIRAALANLQSGRTGQGASTITMQVARNFYLTREKTYTRKIKEVLLAVKLEQILEKEEILSLYLNKIFLGHRAYGFGAASEVYYGKNLDELSLAQLAMLAGLPKAPSTFNPIRNPERATVRRNYVLKRMRTLEWIDQISYEKAIESPVTATLHARDTGLDAPHIAEMVRSQLISELGEEAYWQGLNVFTTIQSDKQIAAQKTLREGLKNYDKRHGFRGPIAKISEQTLINTYKVEDFNHEEKLEDLLKDYPGSREQTPAIVLTVNSKPEATNKGGLAEVWGRDSGFTEIKFADAKWARKYIDANRRGDRPKNISEVLSVGDVVYIQPKSTITDQQQGEDETSNARIWELTQIPQVSGSIISLNPQTGGIISLVGGYDFFLNKYNRATQSIRQPGSNIKPFIYSAALEKGFNPSSMVSGAPIVLTDPAHGTRWRPQNYSGKFFGPTRIREALAKSMNLVSIRLLRAIGIPYAREYTGRFGLDMTRFSRSLTMALGSGGVKPIEMISAYAVLANGGYKIEPFFIQRITNRNDEVVYQAQTPVFCDACLLDYLPKPEQSSALEQSASTIPESEDTAESEDTETLASENIEDLPQATDTLAAEDDGAKDATYEAPRIMTHANNYLTVNMLKDVINRGTAKRARTLNRLDLAGKTGTTNDYVDAWFSGFNSKVVTTVWIGFDQPQTMGDGESGSLAALPIWVDYMQTGVKDIPQDSNTLPAYIEAGFVDSVSGERTTEERIDTKPELFVIDRLTPEHSLLNMKNLPSDLQNINDLEDLTEYQKGNADALTEIDLQDNELIEEQELEDRIIETEEDTEGLF